MRLFARMRQPDPEALAAGLTAEPRGWGWVYHDPKLTERKQRWEDAATRRVPVPDDLAELESAGSAVSDGAAPGWAPAV